MSRFVAQIEMGAAMSRTDLNKAAETILIPLLNEVYGWGLENINYSEDNPNYPGIDLGDEAAKISIQITATHTLDKVKHTLEQFTKQSQYLKYNRLIIYILKKKQDSYSETAIQKVIQNKFNFDSRKDIWDYRDILKEVSNFQIGRLLRVQKILEANFGEDQKLTPLLANNLEQRTDWRETCQQLLNHWKGLTTNSLMKPHGVRFQLNEIFVPLGVVERQEKPKHRSNDGASAAQGSELYEEKITPISQNDFFEQVLRQQQSKYSQGKCIAIIGEPGAGKTTQLQKIGDWILEETDGIPIWIPLAEVGTRKLREYLLGDWLQTAIHELEVSPEHRDELGQLLKTGKVWLLLDGVDEMAISDALYQIATQMCEGWLQNVRVVLTCRLNVWDAGKNALDDFDVYRNLDFEYPTEVHQLIDKWFATEPALQQKLKAALEQPGKERIRDMVKNPLRLTLLCYSWQLQQGELPETKAGLYEWFVDMFYKWDKGKVPIKLSAAKREELNCALGELAKEAIDQESSRFRLRERFINRFLGAADDEDSLFYLARQLGWLNCVGVAQENPLENVYAFFHPTFQEYFAAFVIDDWDYFLPSEHIDNPVGNQEYRIFEPQWREVILLWLGKSPGDNHLKKLKEQFFSNLLCFQDNCGGFYSFKAYFLAAEGLKEFVDYSISKFEEVISEVCKYAFGYFDNETQKWCSFLKPASQEARKTIEYSLGIKQTGECLLKLLNVCPDSYTRWYIAKTLKNMGITSNEIELIFCSGIKRRLPPHVAKYANWIAEKVKVANDDSLSIKVGEQEISPSLPNDKLDVLNDVLHMGMGTNDLIQLIQISDEWLLVLKTADLLQAKTEKCQLIEIINALKSYLFVLKNHLSDQLETKHFRYEYIYEIIWYCAQNISYPDFYQAWHDPISSSDVALSTNNGGVDS
ncbi:SMEK domain-containing protein [Alkalinema sp. FACHB-956]|nr:SMEK domain-containing protein [Alkalinema sp. FACHB-956]